MYIFLIIIGLLILLVLLWLSQDGMPSDVNKLISEVQNETRPELIKGDTGYVQNGNIKIYYEIISPSTDYKATVLLTNGLSYTLLDWPEDLINTLVESGYRVIRYDNRDVGMSSWTKGWNEENAYNLEDMAKDSIALLDYLKIEKVHLIGFSMGGMISQRIALSYPERVLSLVAGMTSGFIHDPDLNDVPFGFKAKFGRAVFKHGRKLKTEAQKMRLNLAINYVLKGKGEYRLDDKAILRKAKYEISERKGYNPKAQERQARAIKKSGSRYSELTQLQIPVLVIHGSDDPLIECDHAKKYAPMIPGVKTLFIEGMGHDWPDVYMPHINSTVLEHLGGEV